MQCIFLDPTQALTWLAWVGWGEGRAWDLCFLGECGRWSCEHPLGPSGYRENSEAWVQQQPSGLGSGGSKEAFGEGQGTGSEGEDVRSPPIYNKRGHSHQRALCVTYDSC